jgi:hypothetical protein
VVFDVRGREVIAREVGSLGPGERVINLADHDRVRPGIYLIRLTESGHQVTKRASIVH